MINPYVSYNGVTKNIPAFISFDVTVQPQQKSAERNSNGRLIRETLPDKWKLEMEWQFKTPEEHYDWFNYVKSLTRVDFDVTFPAPTGAMETATFYVSPITSKMLNFSRGTGGWWKSMKCTFVEV